MFRHIAGEIGGEKYYYCQITANDEKEKYNVPENIFFWWEKENGERIYSPHQIVMKVIEAVRENKFEMEKVINSIAVKELQKQVVEAQKKESLKVLENALEEYEKIGNEEAIAILKRNIEDYKKYMFILDETGIAAGNEDGR